MEKKPRERAIGLQYDPEKDNAPKVKVKGAGFLAERIVKMARQYGVPIKQDTELVESLYALDINQEIPPELYKAIAEILAYVYRMGKKL